MQTKAALDFEDPPDDHEFEVIVMATDPFGATAEANVTIMVTDVNEDPSVMGASSIDHEENNTVLDVNASNNSPDAATYTAADVDEDDNANDLKWSLSGADASKFELDGTTDTRTLSFEANPNYESPGDSGGDNVYEVTLVVTDSEGNTDEQAVTVKVTNVEEGGTVTLSTLQPRIGFPVTATLADPDNITVDSVSWQWYRGENGQSIETISLPETECVDATPNDCPIKDATSDTYTPVADDDGKFLTAVATYTDGSGDDEGVAAGPEADDNKAVLADTRNKAPVFPDQDMEMEGRQTDQNRSVAENTDSATALTPAVAATDEDDNLTYSLGGADAASFSIARNTGMLSTKASLDKEAKDTYTVTVTAEDSLNVRTTITVTIMVTDMDEMPDLEGDAPAGYPENGTGAVATFTATDPEGADIVWSLDGAGSALFMINNGVLTFVNSPDYEAAGTDNMHEVTIRASDGGQDTTASKAVTVEVTNVDEDGTVTLSTLQPQVGEEITATLADPDTITTQGTISWQWYRGNSPITSATAGAGTLTSSYTPADDDVGSALRATAMYDDGEDGDKTAQEYSYRSVRSAPQANTDPVFPIPSGQDNTNQTREVAENTPSGTNLGAPAAASDPVTYSRIR